MLSTVVPEHLHQHTTMPSAHDDPDTPSKFLYSGKENGTEPVNYSVSFHATQAEAEIKKTLINVRCPIPHELPVSDTHNYTKVSTDTAWHAENSGVRKRGRPVGYKHSFFN